MIDVVKDGLPWGFDPRFPWPGLAPHRAATNCGVTFQFSTAGALLVFNLTAPLRLFMLTPQACEANLNPIIRRRNEQMYINRVFMSEENTEA